MASTETEDANSSKPFKYDVFLVHSTSNENFARQINDSLVKQDLKTYAHYKEGSEFGIGKPIVKGIKDAVEKSRIVLVLLTREAMKSSWVTLELLLSLEKSVASGEMCIRLAVYDLTDKQLQVWKDLESIPKVRIDFNRDCWAARLANSIKAKVEMTDILPAGNVALGLVYNYFAGFLNHILPILSDFELYGQFGPYTIVKEGSLNIKAGHADKRRSYEVLIYSIKKEDKVLYFVGESPTIMETLAKLSEFVPKFVNRLQVNRFRHTLMDFVNHKDELTSHADELWKTISSHMDVRSTKPERKDGTKNKTKYATVSEINERLDQKTAHEVIGQLENDQISFANGVGKLSLKNLQDARWNIFIMSKDSTKDFDFLQQYQAAITESIYENKVRVIPILTADTTISDIPLKYRWTTVLQSSHKDYLNQLSKTMNGKSSKMEECWPAGDIYVGLGWSYLLNYLPIVLLNRTVDGGAPSLLQRFQEGNIKYHVESNKCIPCVFIMIPKTCQFLKPGAYFEGEKHLGPLKPVVVGYRKYVSQFYEIKLDSGESVCYAREYATPAVTLHAMAHEFPKSSGLNIPEMYEQSRKLSEFLVNVIGSERFQTTIGDISKHCNIVHFDDEKMNISEMTNELKKRLAQCISSGDFISPSASSASKTV